jgi:hypothetical protein
MDKRKSHKRNLILEDANIFFCGEGPRSRCYGRTPPLGLLLQPCDEDEDNTLSFSKKCSTDGMKLRGENRSTRRKTCPSATLSTTNATWTDPGSNQGLCVGRPAINRLGHSTAQQYVLIFTVFI